MQPGMVRRGGNRAFDRENAGHPPAARKGRVAEDARPRASRDAGDRMWRRCYVPGQNSGLGLGLDPAPDHQDGATYKRERRHTGSGVNLWRSDNPKKGMCGNDSNCHHSKKIA